MAASLNWGAACESHSPPALFAGDDWNVVATFTDAAGNPLDLTGATIMWALLDRNGKAVFVAADFTVAVGPQPGQCTLTVPVTISNLVGNCTGRSPGFAPRRMRST